MRHERTAWRAGCCLFVLVLMLSFGAVVNASAVPMLRGGWYPWMPYQYMEQSDQVQTLTGLDIELFREIFEKQLQITLDLPRLNWDEHQKQLKEGRRDIAGGAFMTEDREQYVYFSTPYRTEDIVLVANRRNLKARRLLEKDAFFKYLPSSDLRLGVVDGYAYGDFIDDFLRSTENSSRVLSSSNVKTNLRNLIEGKVDLVPVDRLVGASLIWKNKFAGQLVLGDTPIFSGPIVALFSRRSTSPALVSAFNQALQKIRESGKYNMIVRGHLFPTLLGLAADQPWFRMLDNIGTAAFAFSGVLLARKEKFSLFGALVLASLPAVGGGILRDLIVNRDRPAVMDSPHHLAIVCLVVLASYVALRLPERHVRLQLIPTLEARGYWIVKVLDAVGLASFTVVGVIVAVEERCNPLLVWGPIFSAMTGAGGAILRDVIRADASHPSLHHEFYAEISLIWGFLLSAFIVSYADVESFNLMSIKIAVALAGIGCLLTRILVIQRGIQAPAFASMPDRRRTLPNAISDREPG